MTRDEVLRVAGEPLYFEQYQGQPIDRTDAFGFSLVPADCRFALYTEAQLLQTAQTAYTKGAADMKERAARAANGFTIQSWIDGSNVYAQNVIRTLPIAAEHPCDSTQANPVEGEQG